MPKTAGTCSSAGLQSVQKYTLEPFDFADTNTHTRITTFKYMHLAGEFLLCGQHTYANECCGVSVGGVEFCFVLLLFKCGNNKKYLKFTFWISRIINLEINFRNSERLIALLCKFI